MRPRSDDRHVSLQDVNELWQFIDVGSAQDSTHDCHARVVFHGLRELISVFQCESSTGISAPRIGSLLKPWRVWRKKTGPRESSFIAIETIRKSGERTIKPTVAAKTSNDRFTAKSNADSGGRCTWMVSNPAKFGDPRAREKFEGIDRNNMEGDGELRQGGSEAHCLRQFFLGLLGR